jgi:hypothetical protein
VSQGAAAHDHQFVDVTALPWGLFNNHGEWEFKSNLLACQMLGPSTGQNLLLPGRQERPRLAIHHRRARPKARLRCGCLKSLGDNRANVGAPTGLVTYFAIMTIML